MVNVLLNSLTLPTDGTVETHRKRLMKHIGLITVRSAEVRMSKSLCVILADLELSVRDGFQLATTQCFWGSGYGFISRGQ